MNNRIFKWFYVIFIVGIAAIVNYCFNIPQSILSAFNLLIIGIAAYKIAEQYNQLKKNVNKK